MKDVIKKSGLILDLKLSELLKDIDDHPDDINLYEILSQALNIRAQHGLAAQVARAGLQHDEESERLWHEVILAESLHKGQIEAIAEILGAWTRKPEEGGQPPAWVLREQALALHLLEHDREARASLELARQLGDTQSAYYEVEGYLKMGRHDYPGALKSFKQAFERNTKNLRALRLAAESYQRMERPEESRKADLAVIQREENFVRAWHNLGEIYLKHDKDPARATQCFARALSINPRDWTVYFTLADEYLGRGELDMARGECSRILALNPPDDIRAETCNYLGYIELKRGRLAAAQACFRQALQISPELAEAWGNLGVIALRRGDAQRAATLLGKAMSLDNQLSWALAARARALLQLKQFDEAKRHLTAASAIDEDEPQLRLAILELAALRETPAATLKLIAGTLKNSPGDTELLLLKARLHAADKDLDAAVPILRELLATDPGDNRAAQLLHDIADEQGKKTKPRKLIIEILMNRMRAQAALGLNPEGTLMLLSDLGEPAEKLRELMFADDLPH